MLLGVVCLQFLAYWELTCFQQYIGATATVTTNTLVERCQLHGCTNILVVTYAKKIKMC
jgi:hypothetical protein